VKSKAKSMLIIFFDIKGNVHKEFALAGQTVSSVYYCEVLWQLRENLQRFCGKLWRRRKWLLHHNNALSHLIFHQGILYQKQHDCRPHQSNFSVSAIEDKTERLPI
jgi:hypothetical protein